MTNTRNAKQKPRTHFEQVPLRVVKKVIAEAVKPAKTGAKNLIVEAAPSKTEPYSVPAHSIAHADIKPKSGGPTAIGQLLTASGSTTPRHVYRQAARG